MKKNRHYLVSLIPLIILLSCGFGRPDKKAFDLKGDFKKITEVTYRMSKDSLGDNYRDTSSVVIYDLNEKGNLKFRQGYYYVENTVNRSDITTYSYNFRNQIKTEHYLMVEDSFSFKTYYLYKKSLLKKIYGSTQDEEYASKFHETYQYRPDKTLKEGEYLMLILDEENKDTTSLQKGVFNYDSNERLVKSTWTALDTNGLNRTETYKYDEQDLLVRCISNEKFNQVKDTLYYEYVFDESGNWIKRTELKNNELVKVKERIIDYIKEVK